MFEIGKHTADQFVLTVTIEDHSVPMLISRRDLLVLWNKIAEIITDEKEAN